MGGFNEQVACANRVECCGAGEAGFNEDFNQGVTDEQVAFFDAEGHKQDTTVRVIFHSGHNAALIISRAR